MITRFKSLLLFICIASANSTLPAVQLERLDKTRIEQHTREIAQKLNTDTKIRYAIMLASAAAVAYWWLKPRAGIVLASAVSGTVNAAPTVEALACDMGILQEHMSAVQKQMQSMQDYRGASWKEWAWWRTFGENVLTAAVPMAVGSYLQSFGQRFFYTGDIYWFVGSHTKMDRNVVAFEGYANQWLKADDQDEDYAEAVNTLRRVAISLCRTFVNELEQVLGFMHYKIQELKKDTKRPRAARDTQFSAKNLFAHANYFLTQTEAIMTDPHAVGAKERFLVLVVDLRKAYEAAVTSVARF